MDNIILSIAKELPSAGAIILVVVIFIRFIREMMLNQKAEREDSKNFFKTIHDEHLDARQLTRLALEKHADITLQNIIATQKNTDRIEQLTMSLERLGIEKVKDK